MSLPQTTCCKFENCTVDACQTDRNTSKCKKIIVHGGEGGIRTPDTLSGISVFKTDCFNRSHTSPHEEVETV